MLLTQYLDQSESRLAEPHRRLMAAVLRAAVDDCRGSRSLGEVFDYVTSTDRVWPFSFENLCDALGVDAECLRRELRNGERI